MGQISVGQAIKEYLKASKMESRINSIKVVDQWETIMGKTIAKYTDKLTFKDGVLIVYTKVAPLKQELMSERENVMKRINEHFKENLVKSVVIR